MKDEAQEHPEDSANAQEQAENSSISQYVTDSLSTSQLAPPSLNSPSVMLEPLTEAAAQQALRFLKDEPFPFKRIAISLLVSAVLVGGVMAYLNEARYMWLGIYVVLALFGAAYFYQNSKFDDKVPLLILFPGRGVKSPQFSRGVGFSLVENIRFERKNGRPYLIFQLRPNMPWPGKKLPHSPLPPDDPVEGRPLRLNLMGLSQSAQQRLVRIVQNHFQAYRAQRY